MIPSYLKYFEKEREVYVQNISTGQISLQFGSGAQTMSFTLPKKRDPINLTNHVPFDLIKASTEFRKMLGRQPAVMRMLTDEEFEAHYQRKAKAEKVSPEAAKAKAEQVLQNTLAKAPLPVEPPKKITEIEEEEAPLAAAAVIHPRVIHLCHQASDMIPDGDRMKGGELLGELKDIAEELKTDDLEYVRANTRFTTVQKWAAQEQARTAKSTDE